MAFEGILMELRRSVTGSPIFARKTLPFMEIYYIFRRLYHGYFVDCCEY